MSTEERTEREDATVATDASEDEQASTATDASEDERASTATEASENERTTVVSGDGRPESTDDGSDLVPLLDRGETDEFRGRWNEIQAGFVDHPRQVVEQADQLVDDLMKRLSSQFGEERSRLEGQWDRDEDVSTEDLRVALTRYRSFFERLLAA